LWFWIIYTGGLQVRYFFPFILISVILCFPRISSFWITIFNRYSKGAIVALLCPFFLLLLLLIPRQPPFSLQRVLGVNLTSGSLVDEVQQAQALVDKAREEKRNLFVYSSEDDSLYAIFLGVARNCKILKPDLPTFIIKNPIDWNRGFTLRFSEIASSDYLVFKPIMDLNRLANILKMTKISDFRTEMRVFRAWLSTNGEASGLEFQSETSLRLAKVVDPLKFTNALEQLKTKYQWREIFLNANPVKWINHETANALIAKSDKAFRNIRFGDKFLLQCVAVNRTRGGLRIELVWESLKKQPLKYTNFIDIFDSQGNILSRTVYEQDPAKRVVNKGALWHDVEEISTRRLHGGKAKSIGLCIYLPPDGFLITDHEQTDRNGRRLLINLR